MNVFRYIAALPAGLAAGVASGILPTAFVFLNTDPRGGAPSMAAVLIGWFLGGMLPFAVTVAVAARVAPAHRRTIAAALAGVLTTIAVPTVALRLMEPDPLNMAVFNYAYCIGALVGPALGGAWVYQNLADRDVDLTPSDAGHSS